jgi:hypothetical protein
MTKKMNKKGGFMEKDKFEQEIDKLSPDEVAKRQLILLNKILEGVSHLSFISGWMIGSTITASFFAVVLYFLLNDIINKLP